MDNRTVSAHLQHGLGSVHGRVERFQLPLLGHIGPFEQVTDVVASHVHLGGHLQRESKITNADIGFVWQLGRIGQHVALMPWVAMEHVDALTDHRVWIEGRPQLAKITFVGPKQFHGPLVDVSNHEIAVDHHHRGLRTFDGGAHVVEVDQFLRRYRTRLGFSAADFLALARARAVPADARVVVRDLLVVFLLAMVR